MSPSGDGVCLISAIVSSRSATRRSTLPAEGIWRQRGDGLKLTVNAMCRAAGSASAFKCHPFLPIASPSAYTLSVWLENATTETRGLPRRYKSGRRDERIEANDLAAVTIVLHDSVYPLGSEGTAREAYSAPMWFITAHAPASSAPGLELA
jgi:hypothetical protein